jgi:circadian clock protein KaiC
MGSGSDSEVNALFVRLIDYLKGRQITAVMTNLSQGGSALEHTQVAISSIIDTWLLLRDIELNGERNRGLYVLKSRGMAHSNQIREFLLTSQGIVLKDVYLGPEGVLTGSARLAQEAKEKQTALIRRQEIERIQSEFKRKQKATAAQIAALELQLQADRDELARRLTLEEALEQQVDKEREEMAQSRKADSNGSRTSEATSKRGRK